MKNEAYKKTGLKKKEIKKEMQDLLKSRKRTKLRLKILRRLKKRNIDKKMT